MPMKKIICIGECALDIIFDGSMPVGSMPGGRIVNAAAILARQNLPVKLVSELAAGKVGDIIAGFLEDAGVDCSSVDRFTEGLSPVVIYTLDGNGAVDVTRYEQYPDDCFDVVWPRIDEGDIVVYGGFYALDQRMRPRMTQLLEHASERKAILVYLPGFLALQEPRITRVMPAILENIELASIVVTRASDLKTIFGVCDGERCYHSHIDFYCRSLINVDTETHKIDYYSGREVTSAEIPADLCRSVMWNAGVVAGVAEALFTADDASARLDAPDGQFCGDLLARAVLTAKQTSAALSDGWKKFH